MRATRKFGNIDPLDGASSGRLQDAVSASPYFERIADSLLRALDYRPRQRIAQRILDCRKTEFAADILEYRGKHLYQLAIVGSVLQQSIDRHGVTKTADFGKSSRPGSCIKADVPRAVRQIEAAGTGSVLRR